MNKSITLALTGASGAAYGLRLLQCLLEAGCEVHWLASAAARIVVEQETGWHLPEDPPAAHTALAARCGADPARLHVYGEKDWFSPVASGSARIDAMVVCPCSMGTLAAIAGGLSDNLLERAADVTLKEGRRLILVPREAPFSAIHLENMLKLARLGATILPAAPGFYHHPQCIEDLVDFIVARVLHQLGVPHRLVGEWGSER
jgi:4-hydroxy-3-polyprenylbenzoate decarboxylase